MSRIDSNLIPPRIMTGMQNYIQNGHPTGDFLRAVFSNDLFDAVGRADEHSLAALPSIVSFIYMEAPSHCHGSAKSVSIWLEFHKAQRDKASPGVLRELRRELIAAKENQR